jgi:histidinol-phosphatase (PHP family)
MWSNVHTHSKYCDGSSELSAIVDQAKKIKLVSLGFSSHAPVSFDCKWCMKSENLEQYLNEINSLQKTSGIELYKGLEVDFIPGKITPSNFSNQLDYTIGSIHFIDAFDGGTPWEVDGSNSSFLNGFEKIFNRNAQAAVTRYFELTRQMIQHATPTIVGHLDKLKIQNINNTLFHESDQWYVDEVTKTLDLISSHGAILEVNTRGLYQKKSLTPYPSPWILELALRKNIPVTLSSDAHHPDDLVNQFSETATLLLKIGYKKISVLKEKKWQSLPFSIHGITI